MGNPIISSNSVVEEEGFDLEIKPTAGSSKVAEAEELSLAIKIGIIISRRVVKDKTRILHHRMISISISMKPTGMHKEDNSKNIP